jgi:hypothetical protein
VPERPRLFEKWEKPGGPISRSTIKRSSRPPSPIRPASFAAFDRAVIDEIQRARDLLLAIKKTVDEDYRPGRFLLTGSANVLTLPRVADSLAGRMETIQMLPLARAEVEGRTPTFLEHLFAGKLRQQNGACHSQKKTSVDTSRLRACSV